jgi:nucleotide-binding universal stress UspA family protein
VKFDVIVVGVDFSPASAAAVQRARSLVADGGTLVLVHAIDRALPHVPDEEIVLESLYARLTVDARREIDAIGAAVETTSSRIRVVVKVGRPAYELLLCTEGADLLVVGTHTRGAVGHFMLGSVAEEVARRSPIPTLVVHASKDDAPGEKDAGRVERVVVAVEPAGPSSEPIRAAAALADRLGARLEAIHASDFMPIFPANFMAPLVPRGGSAATPDLSKLLERRRTTAPELVRSLIKRVTGKDVKVHLVSGHPGTEIPKWLGPHDVLVCGTHARKGVGKIVFGSVATKLIRTSPCPVLIVRPVDGP